jgi:tetratricopeptide (TPR) repeat protein
MDCRKALWLAGGFVCGLAGCLKSQPGALVTRDRPPAPPEMPVVKADDKPAKPGKIKSSTLIALASLRLQMAQDPRHEAERPQLLRQASDEFVKALTADPKYLPAYAGLARCQELGGEYDKAMLTYKKAQEIAPKEPGVWYERGMCQARAKEYNAAIESLKTAVRLAPDNPAYAKVLGFTLARAGQFDEGLTWLKRAMNEADAHFNLAQMLAHLEQFDLSQRHVQIAVQLNPANFEARQLLDALSSVPAAGGVAQVKYEELAGTTVNNPGMQVGFEPVDR